MDPQSCLPDRTNVQVETPFSEYDFVVARRAGIKNKGALALLRLETERMDKTLSEDDIPELVVSLLQHTDPSREKQDGSSPDQHCVYESFDVTCGDPENPNQFNRDRASNTYAY